MYEKKKNTTPNLSLPEIDECAGNTQCSQNCNDTINGFTCYCDAGFTISQSDATDCERKFLSESPHSKQTLDVNQYFWFTAVMYFTPPILI